MSYLVLAWSAAMAVKLWLSGSEFELRLTMDLDLATEEEPCITAMRRFLLGPPPPSTSSSSLSLSLLTRLPPLVAWIVGVSRLKYFF